LFFFCLIYNSDLTKEREYKFLFLFQFKGQSFGGNWEQELGLVKLGFCLIKFSSFNR